MASLAAQTRRILDKAVFLPIVLVAAGAAAGEKATFTGLGFLPGMDYGKSSIARAVSADGRVVVGGSTSKFAEEAFRWTADTGMVGLGFYSTARSVSGDGFALVGDDNSKGFIWTDPTKGGQGKVDIGDLPGGFVGTLALAISADGATVVGQSSSAFGYEAYRWTKAGGMVGLGDLPGGDFDSAAIGVSQDGSVIVGYGSNNMGVFEAFMWTDPAKGGKGMVGLGDLPGGAFASTALAVSADGKVVIGRGTSASGQEGFRWTKAKGMNGLGDLPGGKYKSEARALSADGSVIVGWSEATGGQAAFIWTDPTVGGTGMVRLQDVLTQTHGLDLTGWKLMSAEGISADGRTIVGVGDHGGRLEAFVATIPAGGACYADFTGDGTLDLFDFLAFVNAFNAQSPVADCDGNGVFDLFDFLCYTNAFSAGCL